MTLDTFFQKFDQFADAPDAVAKMRELVLELAVQGKLVEPPSKPETDRAWLAFKKEISERIYGYDPGPPPPFDIPEHWEWSVLAEVADCRASAKVPPSAIRDGDWVLDLEDIDGMSGKIIQSATFAERRSLSTKAAFEEGDVLYSKLRPYLNKVVVAENKGFCTTEIIPLRPASFYEPGFLRIYLRSLTFLNYAAQKNYGMKMPRLGTKDLESAQIPLPPLAEQKRIVAKVDELMVLCDRLEAQQQERDEQASALARASLARFAEAPTLANLNLLFHKSYSISPADLRKGILTLALRGKLVRQDSKEEPAKVLLAELDAERQRFAEEFKFRSQVVEVDNSSALPFTVPTNWKWCRLSSMFNAITDGDHLPPPKSNSGVAFLTIGNITTGTLEFEGSRFVPNSYYQALADFRRPVRGDILYTVVGATYGRPAFVETDRPFCVQRHIAILKPSLRIEVGYLMTVLRSPLVYDQATGSTTGTAQPTIPLGALRNFLVPLPPLAEQRRIVAKVDQLMALVDQLEAQLAASRTTAKNLLEAAVAELTSNDTVSSANGASHPSLGQRPRTPSPKAIKG